MGCERGIQLRRQWRRVNMSPRCPGPYVALGKSRLANTEIAPDYDFSGVCREMGISATYSLRHLSADEEFIARAV